MKRYKPPYTLHRLYEHDDDPLPFLWTNAVVHPATLTPEFPASLRRYNKTVRVIADCMYDTGNSITRICADTVGFELEPNDDEPCILTFTYPLSYSIIMHNVPDVEFEVVAPAQLICRADLPGGGVDVNIILGQKGLSIVNCSNIVRKHYMRGRY